MDEKAATLIYLNQRDSISHFSDFSQRPVKRPIARGIRPGNDADRLH
jgi:hypothetical protein